MDVTVNMTAEEFLEFMEWKRDREHYNTEMRIRSDKWEIMAKKATCALAEDAKRPGKVKIIDQEHAAELLKMAREYLA